MVNGSLILSLFIFDSASVSCVFLETLNKLKNTSSNNIVRKWAKDMDRYFNEKELQMASKHIQRCSTSWAVIKMQIKTTMKSQYEPIWMVKI